jgi:type I restriction enzyme S subunit
VEEIREIPEGWEIDSISKLCDIVDYRGKTPEKVDMGIFLVTAKNIRNGKIDYNISKEYVKTEKYEEIMSRGLPKIGDVLITTEAPLGEVASIDNESIALAQRIIKLRGKREKLENKYLKYYMLSKEFQKEIKNDATGSTVEGIKGSRLKKKMIKFPKSKKEQLVISNILDKLDQNIEKTEQTIEKYKKIKSGLMDDLLTGKIRFKDGKWIKETEFKEVQGIGRIPKDWEVNKLEKISKFIKDGTHGTHKDVEKGIPLLSAKDIYNGKVNIPDDCRRISHEDYNSIHRKYELKEGDILLTIVGTIGRTAIITDNSNTYTFQRSVGIIRMVKDYYSKYIFYYISSSRYQNQLELMVNASAQGGIYLGSLANTILCLPKQHEQIEIVNVLSKQDQLIEKEQQYLEKLKKLKAGLMEDLLTGKVRVKIDE